MNNINIIISSNLKRLREERKLSLDALAKISSVSKSMLSQIERGDVNPTISTVWKIANGLKISFSELMTRAEIDYEVLCKKDVQPIIENEGKYRNYPMFAYDSERKFEMFYIEMDRMSSLSSEPHPNGAQEFIMVFAGEVIIEVDEQILNIKKGCSARFRADRPHSYKNKLDEICELSMVIYYP